MRINQDAIGHAIVLGYPRHKGLFLSELYTEEDNNRAFRGAGTELLKCVVEESYKRGQEGRVTCCAFHDDAPPFMFYYKNNFTISKDDVDNLVKNAYLFNAPLQYIASRNVPLKEIFPQDMGLLYMELDTKGAEALMEGKKLYKDRICDDVAKKNIKGINYSAQFIKGSEKDEYYLQILNDDKNHDRLAFVAALKPRTDCLCDKYFEIADLKNNFMYSDSALEDFAYELLDDLAKKYL